MSHQEKVRILIGEQMILAPQHLQGIHKKHNIGQEHSVILI